LNISIILTLRHATLFYAGIISNLSDRSHRLSFQISQNIDNVRCTLTMCSYAKMIIDLICYHFLSLWISICTAAISLFFC